MTLGSVISGIRFFANCRLPQIPSPRVQIHIGYPIDCADMLIYMRKVDCLTSMAKPNHSIAQSIIRPILLFSTRGMKSRLEIWRLAGSITQKTQSCLCRRPAQPAEIPMWCAHGPAEPLAVFKTLVSRFATAMLCGLGR